MRTRREILDIIAGGETININGVDYNRSNSHKVPSEADLAAGDEKKEAEAEVSIKAQMEQLQTELKKLEAAKAARKSSDKEEKSESKSEPKGGTTGDKTSESKKEEAKAEPKAEAKTEAKSDGKK